MGAAVAVLWMAGDRWWAATLLTFGPRWVVLVPLAPLVLLAVIACRRALVPLAAAAILGALALMGFCVPLRHVAGGAPREGAPVLRVVSYNCGGGGDDMGRFADFVQRTAPDIVILNEWTSNAAQARPIPPELGDGWHIAHNATVIMSRFPIVSVKKLGPEQLRKTWRVPALRCEAETPWGVIHVVGVHLDTPREGLSEVEWKRPWLAASALDQAIEDRRVESELASDLATEAQGPTIIAGDFNMPVDSAIYRRYWSGWQNAFSTAGFGFGYTKHTRRWGVRIDHVLASRDWHVVDAWTGHALGGDHKPVVATLQLK
jgi:endonuclease/exonuclease/phosphatase (EEP) superfamily protein YafD